MNILWFTWKDKKHPEAGGAEFINEELAKQLVKDGHTVKFIVGGYPKCKPEEVIEGYEIIRLGNRFTLYFKAFIYYQNHLKGWPDLIIEEINTIPFMTQLYVKEKKILFVHQLCREIWFYQLFFPINVIGYFIEPFYLRLLNNNSVVTVSNSSKSDLLNYGFKDNKVHVIPEVIDMPPLKSIQNKKIDSNFILLSFGAIRSMKRTLDQVKAFELAKKEIPSLKLKIAGKLIGKYGEKVLRYIENSEYKNDIEYFGSTSTEMKVKIMRESHVILVTSVKEGWGLIVTEAASQGTPAIVYDVDGLRDSVQNNKTGIILEKNTPSVLSKAVKELYADETKYEQLCRNGLGAAKTFHINRSYKVFIQILIDIANQTT